jgi:hypothetical protein
MQMKNIKKRGWFAVLFMKKIGAGHVKTAYSDDLSNTLLMNAKNGAISHRTAIIPTKVI